VRDDVIDSMTKGGDCCISACRCDFIVISIEYFS